MMVTTGAVSSDVIGYSSFHDYLYKLLAINKSKVDDLKKPQRHYSIECNHGDSRLAKTIINTLVLNMLHTHQEYDHKIHN